MMQKLLNNVRKYDLLTVSLLLIAAYFSIILIFDYLNLKETIFWAPDSFTYRSVGNWLFGLENTEKTISRPFFYPLMLNLSRSFGGIYGIWVYQLLLWTLSGVLLYQSIKKATNNLNLATVGLLIFASNLTLMLLTLHALTEVTATFLLTTLLLLIINKQKFENARYWLLVIFIISLLTVIKPVFIYLLFAVLLLRIPVFILNIIKGRQKFRLLLYLILALFPVFVQLSIMKVKHNEFTISKIGVFTLQDYFLARVYGEVNNLSVPQARESISSFDQKQVFEYLSTHYGVSIQTYFKVIIENMLKGSGFTDHPQPHFYLTAYMKIINKAYFILHMLMILPSVFVLIALFKKRNWVNLEMILTLMLPICIIILTSGITFGQGDRIVLPILPLWISLYSIIISFYWHLKKGRRITQRVA